jgi:hypothetical protein
VKLGALVLAGAAGVALAVRKAYQRGRASGVLAGLDIGRQRGFADGLSRGTVIASAAFAGVSLQRPILEDLTLGGRLEERMRGTAARKPS